MFFWDRTAVSLASLLLLLVVVTRLSAQEQKPLTEEEVVQLVDQYKDKAVIGRLEKQGIAFTVDEAVMDRFKKAGASDGVLAAVRKLGGGGSGEKAVSYRDIVQLLQDGVKEKKILDLLSKSPTRFTLGAEQVAELKKLEASDELIKFMQDRNTGTPVSKLTDLVIILDCSGSMDEKTPDGISKMDAAKKVLGEMIPKIPNGMRTCFMIYGHDADLDCQAVKVVHPLASMDVEGKAELTKFINGLRPVGATPIALSLRIAGKELAKRSDAFCGIILITDGMETCKGDPAAEAEKLTKTLNLTFGVNVVGLALNEQETKAVKEIAEHGKGKFFAANTAGDLNKALGELVAKAAPPPTTAKAQRRAINVMEPKVALPALAKLCLTKANGTPPGQNFYTAIAEYPDYGEIRLPSADKYDVWFVPKEGMPIRMLKEYSIKERVIVDVKPEEHLGIVQVTSEKSPELMVVSQVNSPAPGQGFEHRVQHTTKMGESMLVPAGKYDVWIVVAKKAIKVESELEVPAGKITKVE
jgi:hypothetical protein